jgi:hypothetical protein
MSSRAMLTSGDLGFMFHDWLAIYDDDRNPPDDTLVDQLCVCKLEDGPVLIRKLTRSSREGLWRLHHNNKVEHPIDVRLEWAALVREIRPPGPFPADEFIDDFRAAGGRIGIHDGAVFQIYGDAGAGKVVMSYIDLMRADPDHDQKIRQALKDEVTFLSPDEVKRRHAY